MILTKDIESFNNNYDFTDSIITNVQWDSNLLDLLVNVDCYWSVQVENKKIESLTLRFKNCRKATFNMPEVFERIPENELTLYVYSWYTITYLSAVKDDRIIKVNIKTIDNNPEWLILECEGIWVEYK